MFPSISIFDGSNLNDRVESNVVLPPPLAPYIKDEYDCNVNDHNDNDDNDIMTMIIMIII